MIISYVYRERVSWGRMVVFLFAFASFLVDEEKVNPLFDQVFVEKMTLALKVNDLIWSPFNGSCLQTFVETSKTTMNSINKSKHAIPKYAQMSQGRVRVHASRRMH